MQTYFNNIISAYDLRHPFQNVSRLIMNTLPELKNTGYSGKPLEYISYGFSIPAEDFLRMAAQFERLFFKNSLEETHTFNATFYKCSGHYYNNLHKRIAEDGYDSGFMICQDASTRYQEESGVRHLTAVESQLKVTNSHFFKVYTKDNFLLIYTNKSLPFETIIKLKLLQWSLFANKIETEEQRVIEFFKKLADKKYEELDSILDKMMNSQELVDLRFNDLKDLFKPNYKMKLDGKINMITDKEQTYLDYENRMATLLSEIASLRDEIEVLETLHEKDFDATPILKYLSKHPYIKKFEKVSSDTISFYFESPAIYFDPYLIDRIKRRYSGDRIKILNAFKDQKYELMTRCEIWLNTQIFRANLQHIGNDNFLGHPHIDRFNCFGNHGRTLSDPAKEGDHIGAIEQISQATMNINFADSYVINEMLHNLLQHKTLKTWRSKETGVLLSTEEILEIYS